MTSEQEAWQRGFDDYVYSISLPWDDPRSFEIMQGEEDVARSYIRGWAAGQQERGIVLNPRVIVTYAAPLTPELLATLTRIEQAGKVTMSVVRPGGHVKCTGCGAYPTPVSNQVRCMGSADISSLGRAAQLYQCERCTSWFIHDLDTDTNIPEDQAQQEGWRIDDHAG